MIQIDEKLVSKSIFDRKFVCDLNACKGACCVEGEGGAPLADNEVLEIEKNLPEILPYMNEEGKKVLNEQGIWYRDRDGDKATTLVNGEECSFVYFEGDGTAKCAIEKAYNEGKIDFLKPISCHLYPIRVREYKNFVSVNYHEWEICEPACSCGDKLDVATYRFLKEPIIRKFGTEFFNQLCEADKHLKQQ